MKTQYFVIVRIFVTTALVLFTADLKADVRPVRSNSYAIADSLLILPTPRHISVEKENMSLDGWTISVMGMNDELVKVGAEQINRRIAKMGYTPLPVLTGKLPSQSGAVIIGSWYDPEILAIADHMDVRIAPNDPGPQGYVIASGSYKNLPVILLAGSDPQGTLYACITFKRFLRTVDSRLIAIRASVRDWPDFKRRNNGEITLESLYRAQSNDELATALDSVKSQIDFYLNHKINYLYVTGWHGFMEEKGDRYDAAIEALHYARYVGIRTRFTGGVELSGYITDAEKKQTMERKPGTAYAWTLFDAHRTKAKAYAQFLQQAKAAKFVLHPIDTGKYIDPEKWSLRSAEAKKRYGDDRTQAEIEQFYLYFDIIRSYCPNIELEAVSLPYYFQWILDDFPEEFPVLTPGMPIGGWMGGLENSAQAVQVQDQLFAHFYRLSSELDKDIALTFREASREIFENLIQVAGAHPLDIWVYPDRNRGWDGSFTPQVRMAKTFWMPDRDDYYYIAKRYNHFTDGRVQRLAQQEYLWNTEQPDASIDFSMFSRFYETEGQFISSYQTEHLIPRISQILYGKSADLFETVISSNFSIAYIANPDGVSAAEKFESRNQYMNEQYQKFTEVHTNIQAAIHMNATPASQPGSLPPRVAAWILHYYKYAGICAMKAKFEELVDYADLGDKPIDISVVHRAKALLDSIPDFSRQLQEIKNRYDEYSEMIDAECYTFLPRSAGSSLPEFYAPLENFSPEQYEPLLKQIIRN